MGGRIWVESEVGRGSTFHFTVRLGVRKDPESRGDSAGPTNVDDLPVLVVDDNATNRLILEEILTKWRMRPKAVADGPSALAEMKRAAAAGEPYALVLADAMMPGMDGFTLLEQIKQHPELARATLMMLSSADQSGDVARCRRLGVSAYLIKPIKQSELLDAIVDVLGHVPRSKERRGDLAARVRRLEPGESSAPSRRLRILLAEDNPVNQTLATILLEKHGHTVVVAGNGKEALAALGAAAVRPGPDGRADARDGRLRGDRPHPRTGEGDRPAHPDHRDDRPRHQGRPRALPRGGHGRLCLQADRGRRPLPGHRRRRAQDDGGIDLPGRPFPRRRPLPMVPRVCCRIGTHCSSESEAVGRNSRSSWPCFKARFRDRWPRSEPRSIVGTRRGSNERLTR